MRSTCTLWMRRWLAAGLALLVFAACGDSGTGPDDNGNTGNQNPGTNTSQLNFFEEELLGTWHRYHSFDDSDHYYRFNGDRSACKWEEASGSNTRIKKSSYSNWSVDETPTGTAKYRVTISGSGLSNGLTFDYADNELYPTDFTNLKYTPSSSGKTCE